MTTTYLLQHRMMLVAVEKLVEMRETEGWIFDNIEKHGRNILALAMHLTKEISGEKEYKVNCSYFPYDIAGRRGIMCLFKMDNMVPPDCPIIIAVERADFAIPHFFTIEKSFDDAYVLGSWSGEIHSNYGNIKLDFAEIKKRIEEIVGG